MKKRIQAIFFSTILILVLLIVTVSASNTYYKNQLNSTRKGIYDAIYNNLTPTTTQIDLTSVYGGQSFNGDAAWEAFQDQFSYDIQATLDALLKDRPDIYWLKFGPGGVGGAYSYSKKGTVYTLVTATLNIATDDKYVGKVVGFNNQIQGIINNFQIEGTTRYDKVKSIHDQLAAMISYDISSTYGHEIVGSLIYGKAVCEGYAEAFKLLLDKAGIPNVLVIGTGVTSSGSEHHMWNLIQMEDNKWYAVDLTWDDQASRIYYDFFLVGSSTVATHFKNKTFAEMHIPSGDFSGTGAQIFTYPPLNSVAYPAPTTPEPTATATPKPTATATPKPTPTATATPKPTATATPTPKVTVSPTPTPKVTVAPTPNETDKETSEVTASPTPIPTPTPTPQGNLPTGEDNKTSPAISDPRKTEDTDKPTETGIFFEDKSPSPTTKVDDKKMNPLLYIIGALVILAIVLVVFLIIRKSTKEE